MYIHKQKENKLSLDEDLLDARSDDTFKEKKKMYVFFFSCQTENGEHFHGKRLNTSYLMNRLCMINYRNHSTSKEGGNLSQTSGIKEALERFNKRRF